MRKKWNFLSLLAWLLSVMLSAPVYAAQPVSLVGKWKAIDDRSGFTLVSVKITQTQPYTYQGHIIEAFNLPQQPQADLEHLKGFHILQNIKQDADHPDILLSAQVVDPTTKQTYQTKGRVRRQGNVMMLRSPSDNERSSREISWVRIR